MIQNYVIKPLCYKFVLELVILYLSYGIREHFVCFTS